jgi:hypothetical protein
VVAYLLNGDMPTRSVDSREQFDTADALFAREVLNPPMEPAKGLAMPVASAKCWLGGMPVLDTNVPPDEGRSERVERMDMSYLLKVADCVLGIAGSARRKIKVSEECT